ncbi:hypothetical protein MTR67_015849 [Solanum verrucosum]|uniref:Reverse transcriptase domain-containing protein n=1 Tax=Solanum verrucosum TaxID=315347 RepID=A0AAF0TKG1_SOLVR|nr:hypothetical protein MTR67_015849 [Solanum verrucosum]
MTEKMEVTEKVCATEEVVQALLECMVEPLLGHSSCKSKKVPTLDQQKSMAKQGDPLSPFLFILAMEGMSNLIKTTKGKGWIKGFQAGELSSLEITHLQYADDTLVFCEAETKQILILRVIFVIFEAVSGLHINWGKSFIYPINSVLNTEVLARTLGGKVGELPTTYLGMPLGAKSKSKGIWNGVLEKWKRDSPTGGVSTCPWEED